MKYASVASAQIALQQLNGVILCGRPLRYVQTSNHTFLSNYHHCFLLCSVGKALSRSNKLSQNELNFLQGGLGGQPQAYLGGNQGGGSTKNFDTASVHVTFISPQVFFISKMVILSNNRLYLMYKVRKLVNEESLRYLFSQFGEVVDAVICKSNIDKVTIIQLSSVSELNTNG